MTKIKAVNKEAKPKDIIVKIDGKKYKKEQFMIEEYHPAIGRILMIEDLKFKVMTQKAVGSERQGTFISKMTERDEEVMREHDDALDELSEKLVDRIDIKRLIKEKLKERETQDIKTGLFILKAKEDGEEVEEEHHRGCYNYKIHYKNHSFDFCDGLDMIAGVELS
jgi:hypothetical protein